MCLLVLEIGRYCKIIYTGLLFYYIIKSGNLQICHERTGNSIQCQLEIIVHNSTNNSETPFKISSKIHLLNVHLLTLMSKYNNSFSSH